jgi:glycosyltransferase involved in cell wall biosynthesis
MRILHLDAGREMRGGQWQVLRLMQGLMQGLAQGLAGKGVESTLLAREGAPLFEAARKYGLRVEPLSVMRAVMLARRHDLMHAHDARSHTLAALIPGTPLIVSRRVAFGGAGPRSAPSKWKYARARRYIAVSEHVKSMLIKGGVPAEKISVVYDGVPLLPPSLPPSRQAGNLSRVLTIANANDPQKGLLLAGEAAKIAGVPVRATTNLESDLRDAAIFVYITYSEGLGSGALLAMSAGVPVVASDIGGLPEIIIDGETGLLVPNQPGAIAAAIRKLLDNADLHRRIGAAARQTIMQRFSVDLMVRRTLEIYQQELS